MAGAFAEIAFTPSVRAVQEREGSAANYAKFLSPDADGGDVLTEREAAFIAKRDGFYQATEIAYGDEGQTGAAGSKRIPGDGNDRDRTGLHAKFPDKREFTVKFCGFKPNEMNETPNFHINSTHKNGIPGSN